MKTFFIVLLLICPLLAGAASEAQLRDPKWLQENVPQAMGIVGGRGEQGLLVGDRQVAIDGGTRFRNSAGNVISYQRIKPGDRVMVFFRTYGDQPIADRVVLMP